MTPLCDMHETASLDTDSTHYSIAQSSLLLEWSIAAADQINVITNGKAKSAVLVYRGMSGVALATAIVMRFLQLGCTKPAMYYVRKHNERAHSPSDDYNFCQVKDAAHVIFVDDFIASGTTCRECFKSLPSYLADLPRYALLTCAGPDGIISDVDLSGYQLYRDHIYVWR